MDCTFGGVLTSLSAKKGQLATWQTRLRTIADCQQSPAGGYLVCAREGQAGQFRRLRGWRRSIHWDDRTRKRSADHPIGTRTPPSLQRGEPEARRN